MKVKLLIISVIVLILVSVSTPVLAQSPTPVASSGKSGDETVVEGFGSPDVLWNQPASYVNSIIDQYFTDYGSGVYSADDFSNTYPWDITSIFVDGTSTLSAYLTNADSLNWFIYADAGGVPAGDPDSGGELWSHMCQPGDPEVSLSGSDLDVTLDIMQAKGEPLHLLPGTYWLCFFPAIDFGSYGQWFWEEASTTNLSIAQVVDPDNIMGSGWTSWTPWTDIDLSAYDAAFSLDGSIAENQLPPNTRYLHSMNGLFDLDDPINTQWLQLQPMFGLKYHLSSWEDNGDGDLSPSDLVEIYRKPDGPVRPYHVDEVTITLYLTPDEGERGDPNPIYIELVGGYNASALDNPMGTQWHEVYPMYCTAYNTTDWLDNGDTGLDIGDYILLKNEYKEEWISWYVEDIAVDIVVTPEPWPVGGEAYPVNWTTIVLPSIMGMLAIAGILFTFRHRKVKS